MSYFAPKELKFNNVDPILAGQDLVDITMNYLTPSNFLTKGNSDHTDQKRFNKSG
jgi:hypothetical protein